MSLMTNERVELCKHVLGGRYLLNQPIGLGGTAVVFDGIRILDKSPIVVKVLRPHYAYNADLCRRLQREAEVAQQVVHPGIVPLYDVGILEDGSPYLVLKRMYSETLAQLLRRSGPLGYDEVCAIGLRVASILHCVHHEGYVHRDIKPEHILLDRDLKGNLTVSLLDFGICASENAPLDEKERERGRVYGTPSYVSPEQATGNPFVDGRADLFSLGLTLFEALTGKLPFSSSSVAGLLRRIIREDAIRVSSLNHNVPESLDAIIAILLSRDPSQRFHSARAFGRAVSVIQNDRLQTEQRLARRLCTWRQVSNTATLMVEAATAA